MVVPHLVVQGSIICIPRPETSSEVNQLRFDGVGLHLGGGSDPSLKLGEKVENFLHYYLEPHSILHKLAACTEF